MTLTDELNTLAQLRERGVLTEEEFARAKARLLNAEQARPDEPLVTAVNSLRRAWASDRRGVLGMASDFCSTIPLCRRRLVGLCAALDLCAERLKAASFFQ
jgi:Short C-terminal domain